MSAGYLPGERWLVVTGSTLAYLDGSAADALRLWRVLSDGGDVRSALDVLVHSAVDGPDGGLGRLGAFVVASAVDGGLRVVCRDVDAVTVQAPGRDPVPVTGDGLVGWSEVTVPGAHQVVIGAADTDLLPVPGGVVRAAALRWQPDTVVTADSAEVGDHLGDAAGTADDAVGTAAGAVGDDLDVVARAADHAAGIVDDAAGTAHDAADPDGAAAVGWAVAEPDYSALPPLPTPTPLPPLPPFVPAAEVLPPVDPEHGERAIEETRYEVPGDAASAAVGPAGVGPVSTDPVTVDPVSTDSVAVVGSVTPLDGPGPAPQVPIDAVPGLSTHGADGSDRYSGYQDAGYQHDGYQDADHDGLTQLAEDLPIGYTPPPLTSDIPTGAVLAVLCPSGHPNAPHSSTCRLCGQQIDQVDPVPVQRPVLARIRLTTGDVVDLDRPVVLGRAPYASRVAASELPRLVTVPSPNHDISRAHVQIRAADWQLVLADLESTNGTAVQPPGQASFRLHPGQEIVVEPGWTVDLGDGVGFVVEALS